MIWPFFNITANNDKRTYLRTHPLLCNLLLEESFANADYFNADLFKKYVQLHKAEIKIFNEQFTPEVLAKTWVLDCHRMLNTDVDRFHEKCGLNARSHVEHVEFYAHHRPADTHERFEIFFKDNLRCAAHTENLTSDLYLTKSYRFDPTYISPHNRARILSHVIYVGCKLNEILKEMAEKAMSGEVQFTEGTATTVKHYKNYVDFVGKTYLSFEQTALNLLHALPLATNIDDLYDFSTDKRTEYCKKHLIPAPLRPQYEAEAEKRPPKPPPIRTVS